MNLASFDINYVAAVAGGVAYFALGALWYTALFGAKYRALRGISEADATSPPAMMAITGLAGIVTTMVVGLLYEWGGGDGLVDGIVVGLIVGVGVVAAEALKSVVYEQHSWALYAVNNGYAVLGVGLAGAVYSLLA